MKPVDSHLHLFDDALWQTSFDSSRSKDISPLYVDRYRGPRRSDLLSTHDFWELTVIMAGSGTLLGRPHISLKSNTICLIAPGLKHVEQGESDLDTIWIGFTGRHLPKLKDLCSVQSLDLANFIEQLWIFSKQRGGSIGPQLDGLTLAAVAWFFRLWDEGSTCTQDNLMDRAVAYFDEHFSQNITVADVAEQLNCSEGHLHRAFKQHTGHSPIGYLSYVRIQHAVHLLENTDLPIADIAQQVGYTDPFYFSRIFRKLLNQSPSTFRNHARFS